VYYALLKILFIIKFIYYNIYIIVKCLQEKLKQEGINKQIKKRDNIKFSIKYIFIV